MDPAYRRSPTLPSQEVVLSTFRPDLTLVAGVPETELATELLGRLPPDAPPAPWDARCSGVVWVGRGGRAARESLPPALRRRRELVVVGAALRYASTPAGPYDEVLGVVGTADRFRPVGTVVFMGVDSEVSLVGGRRNWAMPKTLASFTVEPASRRVVATGQGGRPWRVAVSARPFGPRLPVRGRLVASQQLADGRGADSTLRGAGRARLALVTVEVESEGQLPTWLRPGRHLGAVVGPASFTLGEPSPR